MQFRYRFLARLPWYNRTGRLGVRHLVTYLLLPRRVLKKVKLTKQCCFWELCCTSEFARNWNSSRKWYRSYTHTKSKLSLISDDALVTGRELGCNFEINFVGHSFPLGFIMRPIRRTGTPLLLWSGLKLQVYHREGKVSIEAQQSKVMVKVYCQN